jgi:hypothetical protein
MELELEPISKTQLQPSILPLTMANHLVRPLLQELYRMKDGLAILPPDLESQVPLEQLLVRVQEEDQRRLADFAPVNCPVFFHYLRVCLNFLACPHGPAALQLLCPEAILTLDRCQKLEMEELEESIAT